MEEVTDNFERDFNRAEKTAMFYGVLVGLIEVVVVVTAKMLWHWYMAEPFTQYFPGAG